MKDFKMFPTLIKINRFNNDNSNMPVSIVNTALELLTPPYAVLDILRV